MVYPVCDVAHEQVRLEGPHLLLYGLRRCDPHLEVGAALAHRMCDSLPVHARRRRDQSPHHQSPEPFEWAEVISFRPIHCSMSAILTASLLEPTPIFA